MGLNPFFIFKASSDKPFEDFSIYRKVFFSGDREFIHTNKVTSEVINPSSKIFYSDKSNQLKIRSDRQSYDSEKKLFVAEGRVKAKLKDFLIRADRIEFNREFNQFLAVGKVRFRRDGQYLQASSLRYNLITKEGELEDVYGVLDLIDISKKFKFNNPEYETNKSLEFKSSEKNNPLDELATKEDFSKGIEQSIDDIACPPLLAPSKVFPEKREGKKNLFLPPIGCPGSPKKLSKLYLSIKEEIAELRHENYFATRKELRSYEDKINKNFKALGEGEKKDELITDQKVENLRLRNAIKLQARFGLISSTRNVDEENKFGGIRVSQLNRFRRSKFISGAVNRWRIQASKLILNKEGWQADKMSFTNDPITPSQVRILAHGVVAKNDKDGDFIIRSNRSRLIFEEQITIPFPRKQKIKKKKELENRWSIGIDSRDRDGIYVARNMEQMKLFQRYKLSLQPQFMFQRAILGKTNSYIAEGKSANSSKVMSPAEWFDLVGIKGSLFGNQFGWDIDLNADLSTLNTKRIFDGSRYWARLNKLIDLPYFGASEANLFAAYRYKAWNGSLGETDIYTAYGGFVSKSVDLSKGKLSNNFLLRFGIGNYQAEAYKSKDMINLWRSSVYASLNSKYSLWSGKTKNLDSIDTYRYSPVPIIPGLALNSNISSSFFIYENGDKQGKLSLSAGPTFTLGHLSRPFLDYTKLSLTAGVTLREGESPFSFDKAVDLATVGIGFSQQIYGPLLINTGVQYNIDRGSKYYGKSINSKVEIAWQRRSYDFSIFYNPYEGVGGIKFRLNDFSFDKTGLPFAPYYATEEKP